MYFVCVFVIIYIEILRVIVGIKKYKILFLKEINIGIKG